MIMKKLFIVTLLSMLLFAACGPSRHIVHVEMRHPSRSGMDMAGKSVSVVFLEVDDSVSNSLLRGMADGFAHSLERDYGTGEGSIGVYKVRKTPGAVFSDKDSLVNLILDTGSDVVFLFDTLKTGTLSMGGPESVVSPSSADSSFISTGTLPFTVRLYGYDSMDKNDKVYSFGGSSIASPHAYSDGKQTDAVLKRRAEESLPDVGFEAGKILSASFMPQWKHEQYSIVYFDSQPWYKAVDYAERYYWKEAMDIWLGLLDTNDLLKRSCAAYNIAVSCFMLGDYELASQWLERSDADNELAWSASLRKRIDARRR